MTDLLREILVENFSHAISQGMHAPFPLDCDGWGEKYADAVLAKIARYEITVEPACPDCEGEGEVLSPHDEFHDCARCDGTGFERMVSLAEIAEFVAQRGWRTLAERLCREFGGDER